MRSPHPLTNLRKAAILLMSLPEEEAVDVLTRLSHTQIESVSLEIAKHCSLESEEQELVIREFAESNPHALGGEAGGLDLAKKLVEKALGRAAADMIENLRQTIEALPFGFLKKVDAQNLLTFINDEHPQTIALVLSHVPPAKAAEILQHLQPERQQAVIRRIARMGQTNPEVLKEVERGLENRMASVMSQSYDKAGGVQTVAEILNVTERATERAVLDNLSDEDPDLVEDIRRLMFVFPDIAKLSDKDVQAVLKNVESNQWALALKGAPLELKTKILGNMSKRAAKMLEEEMEYLGAVRVSEVEHMQQQIVDVVRRLEDTGEIDLQSGEEEEAFIS